MQNGDEDQPENDAARRRRLQLNLHVDVVDDGGDVLPSHAQSLDKGLISWELPRRGESGRGVLNEEGHDAPEFSAMKVFTRQFFPSRRYEQTSSL